MFNRPEYSLATNFDNSLVPALAELGVTEVYGSIEITPTGTGRPNDVLPVVNIDHAISHINHIHQHGIKFTLLLNPGCTGNIEFSNTGRKQIEKYFQFAVDNNVDSITMSNPLIFLALKHAGISIRTKISVHAQADSIAQITWWLESGADVVTIPARRNRDFQYLKSIVKFGKSRFELLLNNACLPFCPLDRYHSQIIAHDLQISVGNTDPCLLFCNLKKLKNPYLWLSSPWIRPEDVEVYESIGFVNFKLTDRCKSSNWLKQVAEAYTKRKAPNNLLSILNSPPPYGETDRLHGGGGLHMPEISINSEKLNNFLLYFLDGNCSGDCPENGCNYCKTWCNRVISVKEEENKLTIQKIEKQMAKVLETVLYGISKRR